MRYSESQERYMFEEDTEAEPELVREPVPVQSGPSNTVRNVIIAVAAIYVIVSLFFIFDSRSRISSLEAAQKATEESAAKHNAAIMSRLGMTEESLKQQNEELASKLGQTEKEVASRTSQLAAQQKAAEQRLRTESTQQINAVASELGG